VLDLEDAVPPAGKADARRSVVQAAAALAGVVPVCVRVNPPGTKSMLRQRPLTRAAGSSARSGGTGPRARRAG
jgi:citrate lyase beta subunit